MSHEYSEDHLIEQTCIGIFKDQLGWSTANVQMGESFGINGTLGRDSEADTILKRDFYQALQDHNPGLPTLAYDIAYETITENIITKPLPETNFEKCHYLKDGIPVTYKNEKGEIIKNKRLKLFDFTNPENNRFLAVQQLWVEGKSKRRRRPDIVCFVNGIALVFIELKAHHRKVRVAYEENLKDYKATIPHLFHCNAFIILSNGIESKIGAITSRFEHFHEWKRIREDEEGVISLETIIRGTCNKASLLDLFVNFILYDTSVGSIVKLVARNHQFLGVNKAITHILNLRKNYENGAITAEESRKLGVFWHTQGSGKSYSMVFLCQKINRVLGGSNTFVLLTDRLELDRQIYGTFDSVGASVSKTARASTGKKLKELLQTDEKYIFTLIHKFNFEETLTQRENIIVISDEAHRTQGGSLALNLRKALPNASFIGFTGTPLFKDDQMTRRIFGDYVSVYDFKRSVEDGATVPLYYENRGEKLKLDNPKITDQIREAIESADLDSDQEDKLKLLFYREYPILTAEKRLRAIAKDVVWHFNNRGYKGKAMFIAMDKVVAVRMYNFITEEWKLYLDKREKEIEKIDDLQEQLAQRNLRSWTKETEVAVVISSEQNEVDKFLDWGLDIEPHREKMNTRDLEKDFKNEEHPFRFAIVCAMWITGFDVPDLSTMYIDKPLKTHTLMQAIARANRVHEEKNNGLIVDYIETYKALLEALAIYAVGSTKLKDENAPEPPVKPLADLIHELSEVIHSLESFLTDDLEFKLETIINNKGALRIAAIRNGIDAVYTNDESKNKFGVMAREVFKKYKALDPDKSIYEFKPKRDAIDAIYRAIMDNIVGADITAIVREVQDIVNQSVDSLDVMIDPGEDYGKQINLSGLDFDLIEKEFLKSTKKNTIVQDLKNKVKDKLDEMLDQNPLRMQYYEKYQEIIELYNLGKDYASIKEIFDRLKDLYTNLTREQKRAFTENLSQEELAVFDMLERDKKMTDKEKNEVKDTARHLLKRLIDNEFRVERWAEKVQTASAVRKAINDYLFNALPYPTYENDDISKKTDVLFNFFKSKYRAYNAAG